MDDVDVSFVSLGFIWHVSTQAVVDDEGFFMWNSQNELHGKYFMD